MADENIKNEPGLPNGDWDSLQKIVVPRKVSLMSRWNVALLAVASFVVGLIMGGLTVATVEARQHERDAYYASDFIMRQIERISKCEEQNRDLQKKNQELEKRLKEKP